MGGGHLKRENSPNDYCGEQATCPECKSINFLGKKSTLRQFIATDAEFSFDVKTLQLFKLLLPIWPL
jgi:hypothetical protein